MIAKELVEFFWATLSVTPALVCCIRGVPHTDAWIAIQVLVHVLEENPFGERIWILFLLGVQVLMMYLE